MGYRFPQLNFAIFRTTIVRHRYVNSKAKIEISEHNSDVETVEMSNESADGVT